MYYGVPVLFFHDRERKKPKKTTPTLPPKETRTRAPGAHVRRLKSALHNLWNCCCFSGGGGGVTKWVVSWVLKWILDMKIKKENFKHVILFSDGSGRERFSPEWLLRDTNRNTPPSPHYQNGAKTSGQRG